MEPALAIPAPRSARVSYTWDGRLNHGRGGFRSEATGRAVAWAEVRAALDRTLDSAAKEMASLSAQLQDGRLSLAEWQQRMSAEVKSAHVTAYVLQRGGWQQMSPADYGRIGRALYNPNGKPDGVGAEAWGEYQYLRRMAEEIATGKQRLDGTLLRRARQYAQAGRHTYHRAQEAALAALGFDEARYVLNPADHCQDDPARGTMGCVTRAGMEWQPLGVLPRIGETTCNRNDRCDAEYRNSTTGTVFSPG
jgi:hypothetical protein